MVEVYSEGSGPQLRALGRYYRLAGILLASGIVSVIIGIFLVPAGTIAGLIFAIASIVLVLGGAIAVFNVAGVATEYGAWHKAQVLARWPHGSVGFLRGEALGRLIGFGFVLFGVICGLIGVAIILGWLLPTARH